MSVVPYILHSIESQVRQSVNLVPDPQNFESYIGSITYCKKMFNYHFNGEIFLEPEEDDSALFKGLHYMLSTKPMARKGIMPDAVSNLAFLRHELDCWTNKCSIDLEDAPWMKYRAMWEGIPKVSECAYSRLMSVKYNDLLAKLALTTDPKTSPLTKVAINRTFLVNFSEPSFCPIGFGFCFDYQLDDNGNYRVALLVMINFRSLEVSRNIINDLYLFLGFLRRLIFDANPGMTDRVPITSLTITSMDAHIIDL